MSKRQLTIDVEEVDGISIVSLSGAIDASNVRDFAASLDQACRGAHPRTLLDCSNLTYVNSTSFGLFFKYHRACEKNGGALALCGIQGKIRNIIKILGLDKFLSIHPGRKEGLAFLKKVKTG